MECPHCRSKETKELARKTDLGYAVFQCGECRRVFNERTGTVFSFLAMPTDIVFQVVLFRLRCKLSLRDLVEMFSIRGYEFSHETVRDWESRFAPLLAEELRRKRKHQAGPSRYVDETYIKVQGKCCYLYRAIDRDGQLVDSMLSATRDMAAAQRFFRKALATVGKSPERVTTDGPSSYPRVAEEVLGDKVQHRCNQYLNNRLEQDHRGVKQRYYPMLGFRAFRSAQRFCPAFDELRNYLRYRRVPNERVSLAERRQQVAVKLKTLHALFVS